MTDQATYEYKWTGDYPVVIDGHTTPEGTGVKAKPGQKFTTIAPVVGVPLAVPVSDLAKAAAVEVAAAAEAGAPVEVPPVVPKAKSVAATSKPQEATPI